MTFEVQGSEVSNKSDFLDGSALAHLSASEAGLFVVVLVKHTHHSYSG